jgi:hypothetical protein
MSTTGKPRLTRVRLTPGFTSGVGSAGLVLLGAALLAATALALGVVRSGGATARYTVNEQVSSHGMSPTAVADKVLAQLASMGTPVSNARILSMTVTTGANAADYEAGSGRPGPDSPEAKAVVWVVRAEGSFVGLRVPPGAKPITSSTGYFIIDDATGDVVGMGMP